MCVCGCVCVCERERERERERTGGKRKKKEQGAEGRDVLLLSGSLRGNSLLASAVVRSPRRIGDQPSRALGSLQGASSLTSPEVAPRRGHCPGSCAEVGTVVSFSRDPGAASRRGRAQSAFFGEEESGPLATRPRVPAPSHRPTSSPQPHSFFLSSF